MKYRADIDGLRAVAVVPVVAFHVGLARVPGGFVGVDVFFVISGFLISSIMLAELSDGRFSLLSFYERRVRRIAPALVAMLVGTTALAAWYSLPQELTDYARSLMAAALSVSNILFWAEAGYFDGPAASKPLLHTWSLSVEEQFYLLLPLFLMIAFRLFRRRLTLVIGCIAAASLAASAVGVFVYPEASFYLLHTRAWELLLGTLLALDVVPPLRARWMRDVASLGGLAMIAASVLTFSAAMPFPGLAALLPCAGAALVIAGGRDGPSSGARLLSLPPVVFIGRISYSLYLWHWPVIVFQRLDSAFIPGSASRTGKLVMVALSLALATASWWWIERPFRGSRSPVGRRALFAGAACCAALAVAFGVGTLAVDGAPARFPPDALRYAGFLTYGNQNFREGRCFLTQQVAITAFDPAACLPASSTRPSVLVLGDSLAAHLWHGLAEAFPGLDVQQATASGCKPTLDQPFGSFAGPCSGLMTEILRDRLPREKPARLLIAARWTPDDLPRLGRTLDWVRAQGVPVLLFGPMVQYDSALPRLLAFAAQSGDAALPGQHRLDEHALDAAMADLARQHGAAYVSPLRLLCPAGRCVETAPDGIPVQFDYGHFTGAGSVLFAQRLRESRALP